MLNHARTLLMNIDSQVNDLTLPGSELLPNGFHPLRLPGFLQQLRATIFGPQPDQFMLNYRVRQLLGVLHATELGQFLLDLDPRISYELSGRHDFFSGTFGVVSTPLGDTTAPLLVLGDPAPADATGRCRREWSVSVSDASTVSIGAILAGGEDVTLTYGLDENGRSSLLQLPLSDLWFRVTGNVGDQWSVVATARPYRDLGEIAYELASSSAETMADLFAEGTPQHATEPFQTFANLWYRHPQLPYKLGGLLLAMIYRSEEVRQTGAVNA